MRELGALAALLPLLLWAVETGVVPLRLPSPAARHTVRATAHLPWAPSPLPPGAPNSILKDRAVRLFDGRLQGPGASLTAGRPAGSAPLAAASALWLPTSRPLSLSLYLPSLPPRSAETVAFTPDGALVAADKFGGVHRALPSSGGGGGGYELPAAPAAHLGAGRPLGLAAVDGALLVCDALKGLLNVSWGPAGGGPTVALAAVRVSDASQKAPGSPITYANDLDVARDGARVCTRLLRSPPQLPPPPRRTPSPPPPPLRTKRAINARPAHPGAGMGRDGLLQR